MVVDPTHVERWHALGWMVERVDFWIEISVYQNLFIVLKL